MCSSLCSDCVLAPTLQCSACCVDVSSLCACVYTVSTELIPRLCASDLCISLVFVVLTSACLYFLFVISACLCASCLCPVLSSVLILTCLCASCFMFESAVLISMSLCFRFAWSVVVTSTSLFAPCLRVLLWLLCDINMSVLCVCEYCEYCCDYCVNINIWMFEWAVSLNWSV